MPSCSKLGSCTPFRCARPLTYAHPYRTRIDCVSRSCVCINKCTHEIHQRQCEKLLCVLKPTHNRDSCEFSARTQRRTITPTCSHMNGASWICHLPPYSTFLDSDAWNKLDGDVESGIDKTISLIFIMCALRIHANECKRMAATLK